MSGGFGDPLAAVCMTHRCVDMLCYSQPHSQLWPARWTRLVSWVKAAGLGDGYSEIKTKLWRWNFKEASPPHWPADRGLTTYFGAITLSMKRARTIGILIPSWPDERKVLLSSFHLIKVFIHRFKIYNHILRTETWLWQWKGQSQINLRMIYVHMRKH